MQKIFPCWLPPRPTNPKILHLLFLHKHNHSQAWQPSPETRGRIINQWGNRGSILKHPMGPKALFSNIPWDKRPYSQISPVTSGRILNHLKLIKQVSICPGARLLDYDRRIQKIAFKKVIITKITDFYKRIKQYIKVDQHAYYQRKV